MRIKISILLIILGALTFSPLMAATPTEEANSGFTYNGKPIHPFLLGMFSNWLSDARPPMVTTVDVAAAFDTNQFSNSIVQKRGDSYFAEDGEDTSEYKSFGYRWHGKMSNDVHVVELGAGGGGSGTFMDLLFIKFSDGGIVWEGKKDRQLLMTVVRTYSLGDRYDGDIKVFADKVIIGAAKHQYGGGAQDKDIELKF